MQSIRQVTPGVELIRVVPDFYPSLGGSIIHTAEAARRINLHLAKQIILAPMNPPESEKRGEFNGIPIIRLPSRNREICGQLSLAGIPVQPFVVWTYAWQVAKAIGNVVGPSDEHTIVHVHGTLLGAMVCLLMPKSMRNIPVVITQDSANPLRISKRERITTWLALLLLTLRKPSLLIVVDDGSGIHQFGRILQRKGIPYQVVNHAIDVPKQADTEEGKRREFVILSTSRLVTFKRVDLAVLGFAEFYRSIGRKDGIRFVIIGDGPERDKLEKIVKEHELDSAVRFEGWKNHKEVLEALSRSDVVVGTSLISNLNLSIQEAMAAGCAVVVFDNGEMGSLIRHLRNGILVETGNLKALADAFGLLYGNQSLRRSLGFEARNTIEHERSWEARIRIELDSYERLLTMVGCPFASELSRTHE